MHGTSHTDMSYTPPNHKAEIAKKLMLILTHFKIIELLKNIFKKFRFWVINKILLSGVDF